MERILFLGASNPETRRMMRAVARVRPVFFEGFLDNDAAKWGTTFCDLPVLGGIERFDGLAPDIGVVNLITRDAMTRYATSRAMAERGARFANFIHPDVDLTDVALGTGNYVQEAVVLQGGVRIGDNSSVHMGALIGHESVIGSSSFVAHGVAMSGLVRVGDGVFIGAGAVILPRVSIGDWCTIGAGAVVTKDLPPGTIAVGNPARALRTIDLPDHSGAPWP